MSWGQQKNFVKSEGLIACFKGSFKSQFFSSPTIKFSLNTKMISLFHEKFEHDPREVEFDLTLPLLGKFGFASPMLLFWIQIGGVSCVSKGSLLKKSIWRFFCSVFSNPIVHQPFHGSRDLVLCCEEAWQNHRIHDYVWLCGTYVSLHPIQATTLPWRPQRCSTYSNRWVVTSHFS